MKIVEGGVCAAQGFKAGGIHCGIRKNKSKRDLSMIVSTVPAHAAAVYTTNLVKGAPLLVTKEHLSDGCAQAILCNSGNANTCNADGVEIAQAMCTMAAQATGLQPTDIIIASTGVIGQPLPLAPIAAGMEPLAASLSEQGSAQAAEGIMTTDTVRKEMAVSFVVGSKTCHLGGIAKGSGMIAPNMATMLVFLTTDANISSSMLQKALSKDVKDSFNMVSVDGDTSTNDMVAILANGLAGNAEISAEGADFSAFREALAMVTQTLCKAIAKDGEGATRLITCKVSGAKTTADAKIAAKAVVRSSLLKAAIFGADANWGRVLCALGYSGAQLDVAQVGVTFASAKGSITVCTYGAGVNFSEEKAKEILLEDAVEILITLQAGTGEATAWGCDLTYDYVKINGDYRT